jgi:eukaryotic translation initiation factor 2C
MLTINARLLPAPTLAYSGNTRVTNTANGSWNLRDVKFLQSNMTQRYKWALLEFKGNNRVTDQDIDTYLSALRREIPRYFSNLEEMQFSPINQFGSKSNNRLNNREAVRSCLNNFSSRGISIVFVVLPSQDTASYELLKLVADVDLGLHTVCVVKKGKSLPSSPATLANILMKVNLKLGGKTVKVQLPPTSDPAIKTLYDPKTMIVGADVTHPGPGSMRDVDTIAAVVASEDSDHTRYPASIRCQTSKMEMIEELDTMLGERLEHWKKKNGDKLYPSKIVFYRDGVSEGQFQQVLDLEWPQIQSVIQKKYDAIGQIHAPVVLLSVQKRHHTRFYPKFGTNLIDKEGNPRPGLIVDDAVTSLDKFDWFLQSHHALLGTAKPANYVVLQDQIGCDVDALQKGTHWQCFTFGRSTTSISVHPAARYADLACGRARAYLREFYAAGNNGDQTFDRTANAMGAWKGKVHPNMENTMFYV